MAALCYPCALLCMRAYNLGIVRIGTEHYFIFAIFHNPNRFFTQNAGIVKRRHTVGFKGNAYFLRFTRL